jgi:hypothetical protein
MDNVNQPGKGKTAIYVVTILATFLLMAFLVKQMVKTTNPAPLGADRGAARAKDQNDLRAAHQQALSSWGMADAQKGIVRLPIDEAMKVTIQGYKDAAAFRKDLVARSDKASAPAPKPPEKPNEFE